MLTRPGDVMPCAERHTDRIPPPVGTRGVLGVHRVVLRFGAAGVRLRG
ncbi:hypothetical protein AB0L02_17845 [Streptomyces anulatus]